MGLTVRQLQILNAADASFRGSLALGLFSIKDTAAGDSQPWKNLNNMDSKIALFFLRKYQEIRVNELPNEHCAHESVIFVNFVGILTVIFW